MTPHPTSLIFNLILSSHLSLGLPSRLFPSSFSTKTLYTPLFPPCKCYMPRLFLSSRSDHLNIICWVVLIIKLLIMYFSPLPCYLVPLRPKYRHHHPLLTHTLPTFLPQRRQWCITPIQNKRQIYSSVYLHLHVSLLYILYIYIYIYIYFTIYFSSWKP